MESAWVIIGQAMEAVYSLVKSILIFICII